MKQSIQEFLSKQSIQPKQRRHLGEFQNINKRIKRQFIIDMQRPILNHYCKIHIKPMSKNYMFQRCNNFNSFTQQFHNWSEAIKQALPVITQEELDYLHCHNFCLFVSFGVKEVNTVLNNLLMPFQTVIDKHYNFNERVITRANLQKVVGDCTRVEWHNVPRPSNQFTLSRLV